MVNKEENVETGVPMVKRWKIDEEEGFGFTPVKADDEDKDSPS